MHSTRSNSPVSDLDSTSSNSSYYSDASPTDYGPSLTRPTISNDEEDKEDEPTTVEAVNPTHTSVEIQVEDDIRKSSISPRIGRIILSYWMICVCIIPIALMASPLVIPIILLKVMEVKTAP